MMDDLNKKSKQMVRAGIILPLPVDQIFYYALPCHLYPNYLSNLVDQLSQGCRVEVPFGQRKKNLIGVVWTIDTVAYDDRLSEITAVLDQAPLWDTKLCQLFEWASNYYQSSLGEVVFAFLPQWLRKGKNRVDLSTLKIAKRQPAENFLALTAAQSEVVDAIKQQSDFTVNCLEGVTGSGKTEVYLQLTKNILEQKKSVLVLVPEIGLTPQTVSRFEKRFPQQVSGYHSRLSEKKKQVSWESSAEKAGHVIVGTRSSVGVPFKHLGLIIIDESHDLSFKQQKRFAYSARDLSIMRAKLENIPIILGSATLSLETYWGIQQQRYQHFQLLQRVNQQGLLPVVRLIDMRCQRAQSAISSILLEAIRRVIARQGQVLLFINRRGYAPVLLCEACGWSAFCDYCDAKMAVHAYPKQHLHCHHCDRGKRLPSVCPQCCSSKCRVLGVGTERIEMYLREQLLTTDIIRVDRDSTRRQGEVERLLDQVNEGHSQVLIGTQMLAKGHHFPNVQLVGVLDADGALFSADFRAEERLAQLMTQVAGRAGRGTVQGEVLVQTHHPDHPVLQILLRQDYRQLVDYLLPLRRLAQMPPYAFLVVLRARGKDAESVMQFLQQASDVMSKDNQCCQILGPIAAPIARKANYFYAQLLLKSSRRQKLQQLMRATKEEVNKLPKKGGIQWYFDVDAQEVL